MSAGAFPNFIIIGAQKSATRWLRLNLGQHPQIFTAPTELEYFNHNWNKGSAWYHEKFGDSAGANAIGEATPGYMMWNEEPARQAARIDGFLPEARIFAILRNPVDRAYSAFIHFLKGGRFAPESSFMEHVRTVPPEEDPSCIVAGGWYGACLEPYVERFGERLMVIQQDDLSVDPVGVYRKALRHIGLPPDFVAPNLRKVRFSNTAPEISPYNEDGERKELTPEERRELYEYFREDLRLLEHLVDIDVARWSP